MIALERDNVVKIVESEERAAKLEAIGFKRKTAKPAEEKEVPDDGGSAEEDNGKFDEKPEASAGKRGRSKEKDKPDSEGGTD